MKILVVGGNRFFGKRLVGKLLRDAHEVTLLNRGNVADPFGTEVERLRMDRRELAAEHPALRDRAWDIVFDQVCYEAPEALGACAAFHERVGRYVFISSQSVYGPGKSIPESDFDPLKHSFHKVANRDRDYAEAKRQCEAVLFRSASFPVAAVRFPIVVGPDDYTGRLRFHVERVREGRALHFPNPKAQLSLVHSEDAAEFLRNLVARPLAGPVNVAAKAPMTIETFIEWLGSGVGQPVRLVPQKEKDAHSPYGIAEDWYMSVQRMLDHGYVAREISTWLPPLIRELAAR